VLRSKPIPTLICILLFCLFNCGNAVANDQVVRTSELPIPGPVAMPVPNEFVFARLRYAGGFEWPRWRADYPEAEYHFSQGLRRLSQTDVSGEGVVLKLTDDTLFDYPWLYAVEVGHLLLSKPEITRLREYLQRGGFLVIDDFHGAYEWQHFMSVIRKVFPDRKLTKLDSETDLFNIHFDIEELIQVPGIRSVMNGRTWEKGGVNPAWYAIRDDHGRIMVVINFNQDLGDAWEHADDAHYPQPFTGLAYRMGVNYVIYAMTH